MSKVGLINDKYFSLNSLFRVSLNMHLTHSECIFLSRGIKYANTALRYGEIKKRRDRTLYNNYSTQYPYELSEFACHLLLAHRDDPAHDQIDQDILIKKIFIDLGF